MMNNNTLKTLRRSYSLKKLDEKEVDHNPFIQFKKWMEEALNSQLYEPTAMTLATSTKSGIPSCRIVLLKGIDEDAFLFFTNYGSRKSTELIDNPSAALLFFWQELERQVRIEGKVEKVSQKISEEYFNSRPIESRLGAWASAQSEIIPNRQYLEHKFEEMRIKYSDGNVPLPPNWGGFKLIPHSFEFWQGRESRLHDRIFFSLENNNWKISRLAP